jgi:glycosyltransferase involved in cell wall biosynthesis
VRRTVAHFVSSAEFGGTEQALLHLLAGLEHEGWRQVLVHHPEPRPARLIEGARQCGVPTRCVPRTVGSPGDLRRWIDVLRAEQPDVFHAHLNWPLACRTGLLMAAALRVRARVATVQLFIGGPWPVQSPVQRLLVAPTVGRFVAVSHGVAEQLHASFGVPLTKLRVVHNGIRVADFADVAPVRIARAPVVLTTARLDPQKGLPVLLEAATKLPDVSFVVAGDGPERPVLAERARTLGVAGRVHFVGHRTDIAGLLAGCDVFVLPSVNEGLPLALLEAMAAGRPLIASAIPGVSEAVVHGQSGLLVPPGDSTALAAAIRRLLVEPDLRRRLASAARARVEREFSAEDMVRGVAAAYVELLDQRGRGPHTR